MKNALPFVLLAGAGVLVFLAMRPAASSASSDPLAGRRVWTVEERDAIAAERARRAGAGASGGKPTGAFIDDALTVVGGVLGTIFGGPAGGAAGAAAGHGAYAVGDAVT